MTIFGNIQTLTEYGVKVGSVLGGKNLVDGIDGYHYNIYRSIKENSK